MRSLRPKTATEIPFKFLRRHLIETSSQHEGSAPQLALQSRRHRRQTVNLRLDAAKAGISGQLRPENGEVVFLTKRRFEFFEFLDPRAQPGNQAFSQPKLV